MDIDTKHIVAVFISFFIIFLAIICIISGWWSALLIALMWTTVGVLFLGLYKFWGWIFKVNKGD